MTTATIKRSVTPAAPPLTRRGGRSRETILFLIGLALIALHVLDDNFVQPQPGTSPGDHLVSGLVPLALLGLAAWAYPRLRGGRRGALALFTGVLGIAAGSEAISYLGSLGPSGDDFTGLLAVPAGLLLLGLGVATLWRTRRTAGSLAWRYPRRGLLGVAGTAVAAFVLFPLTLGYVSTHVGRAVVPDNNLGVPHEDVKFSTSDGLELEGWYIPSRNGAAVIAVPGRKGPQSKARMLARHGYGVLLFDRRGEGASDGDPHAFGWGGAKDIDAAIAFLQRRPDVEPGRIGGIGLSVGGELMLEAAAGNDALAGVVSEGAGARSLTEELDAVSGVEKVVAGMHHVTQTGSLAVFSGQSPPANLRSLVPKIAPRPVFLIQAPNSGYGEELNDGYHRAAKGPAINWRIPEAKHTGGLDARPDEYERRVVGFFNDALL
jgi:uncharacterized protein